MPRVARESTAKAAAIQQKIQPYARVTKSRAATVSSKPETVKLAKSSEQEKPANKASSKRKHAAIEVDSGAEDGPRKSPSRETLAVPSTPHKKARTRLTESVTPTTGARSLFQGLEISITSSPVFDTSIKSDRPKEVKQLETPPSSQGSDAEDCIPAELQDLFDIASAFLTVYSINIAHHGSSTPADLRKLFPAAEQIWGKRRIVLDDIRRIVYALNRCSTTLEIAILDFGNDRYCLELESEASHAALVNERALHRSLVQTLLLQWDSHHTVEKPEDSPSFTSSLELQPIKNLQSTGPKSQTLQKTQAIREELKSGARKAQERANTSPSQQAQTSTTCTGSNTPQARAASLKARLFAKQLLASSGPKPLTPQQLARRSALQRLPEVSPVLESMALSHQRHRNDDVGNETAWRTQHTSFTLATVVQNIQMSLRNPISADEAGLCVRVAAELAGEWITVRAIGKMVGVTVAGGGIGRIVMARRVQRAVEEL